jgi:hypothetical protein
MDVLKLAATLAVILPLAYIGLPAIGMILGVLMLVGIPLAIGQVLLALWRGK